MRYLTKPVYLTHSCFSKFAESEPDKAQVSVSGGPVYSVDAARLSLLSNIRAGWARGYFLERLSKLSGTDGNEMRQTYITIYELAARLGVPIGLVMEMMERQVIKPRGQSA